MVLDYYLGGAYYPKGGSGALRDAFLNALQEHGVEMVNRSRVTRIDKRGAEFAVETESGQGYSARAVISDADPAITLGELANPEIVPSKIRKKALHLRPSTAAFYAFIGTDLDLPSLGISSANIHHHEDWDVNVVYEGLNVAALQAHAPYCFITSPSVKDPQGGHAPKGYHTVEILTGVSYEGFEKWANSPAMRRGKEYEALKERIGAQLIATAERHIPGLSGHLDWVEYATPLSSEYWVNAVRGGMYGPEETPDQMGGGRFADLASGVEGLYLVGAGTHGGGISACVESGIMCGRLVGDYLGK
jgi:phytoene dehydrogenase-like protein